MRGRLSSLRDFAKGSVIPLLAVLLEVLWVHGWLVWVSELQAVGWDRPPLSILGAVIIVTAAEVVARGALARQWSLAKARVVAVSLLCIVLALVVRVEHGRGYALWDTGWGSYVLQHQPALAVGLIAGIYLLWRGIVVGRERLSFDTLYPRFLFGLTALVVLLIAWGLTVKAGAFERILAVPSLYVVAYFTAGLLALALANFQSLSHEMRRGEGGSFLSRRWFVLVAGVLAVIVMVSIAVASVFSFDLVLLLTRPLNTLADWLFIGFQYLILLPLGLLAALLIYVLRFLVSLLNRGKPPDPFSPSDVFDLRRALEGKDPHVIPPWVPVALKWGLVALVGAVVCVLLARALFRYWRAKEQDESEETSESLWSWDAFRTDLRAFLLQFLQRFRRGTPANRRTAAPPIASAMQGATRLLTAREIYQGLLWEGRKAGRPRRDSETPHEYEEELQRRLAEGTRELRAITEAYVTERYGDEKADPEHRGTINRLWQRLRAVFDSKVVSA